MDFRQSGLVRLIRATYKVLGLISFYGRAPTNAAPGRFPRTTRAKREPARIIDLEKEHYPRPTDTIAGTNFSKPAPKEMRERTATTSASRGQRLFVKDGDVIAHPAFG